MITDLETFKLIKESHSSYMRVIPRDFFNESKLLKCMGWLMLKIHEGKLPEGIEIEIEDSGEPFNIELDNAGMLYVSNYPVRVNGEDVLFTTKYNSKDNFPMYCTQDEIPVFDEQGNFDQEFIDNFTTAQA